MGADKGKKQRSGEVEEEKSGAEHIDGELVLSIEKLQEIQDDLEKVVLLSFIVLEIAIFIFCSSFHCSCLKVENFSEKSSIPFWFFFFFFFFLGFYRWPRIYIHCASLILPPSC